MIHIKNQEEIKIMADAGRILSQVLRSSLKAVREGTSEQEIDLLAEGVILKSGAEPAFKKVKDYRYATCISTNSVVVHGIPSHYKLKDLDIVGIDCGVFYKGFNSDMSETVMVGKKNKESEEIEKFLNTGKTALLAAIKQARAGNRIGNISKTIQDTVEGGGYSVVRSLIGHGVGRQLHEDPEVPGFLDEEIEKTPLLKKGMTIAIEVIYNMGEPGVVYSADDRWTIKTEDGSLSGLFERTVAITDKGPRILTP